MFRATNALLGASPVTTQAFSQNFHQIWRDRTAPTRLGLAISGGVDSMALANLCSRAIKDGLLLTSLKAFIVDHGLRARSTIEAKNVASELERLQIESQILTLDWREHGDTSTAVNIESIARRLRYQALGIACRNARITSLLVAHHADDQAETVMMRIVNTQLGLGLQGIRREARIPECEGLYGVHASGSPKSPKVRLPGTGRRPGMQLEGGGVSVVRPLLSFTKDELAATCKHHHVRWFEDHTNEDRSLTLRNTIRYLQTRHALPVALQRPRLQALATQKQEKRVVLERKAQQLFVVTSIGLDLRTGQLDWTIPPDVSSEVSAFKDVAALRAVIVRKAIALITPTDTLNLQDLGAAVDTILPKSGDTPLPTQKMQVAGIEIAGANATGDCRTLDRSGRSFRLQRGMPSRPALAASETRLPTANSHHDAVNGLSWSEWHLWDSRYWMRVGSLGAVQKSEMRVSARFLTPDDLADLRGVLNEKQRKRLDERVTVAKGSSRFTLPVLLAHQGSAGTEGTISGRSIVALPSLGWSTHSCWRRWTGAREDQIQWYWDIRYRHVDLTETSSHRIIP